MATPLFCAHNACQVAHLICTTTAPSLSPMKQLIRTPRTSKRGSIRVSRGNHPPRSFPTGCKASRSTPCMETVLTPKAERIIAVIVGAISLTTVAVTPWPTIDELLGISPPPNTSASDGVHLLHKPYDPGTRVTKADSKPPADLLQKTPMPSVRSALFY